MEGSGGGAGGKGSIMKMANWLHVVLGTITRCAQRKEHSYGLLNFNWAY